MTTTQDPVVQIFLLLTDRENRFDKVIVGGLESWLSGAATQKLKNCDVLLPGENRYIVHAVNQAYFEKYGPVKPDTKVCQKMAKILKRKFPSTFCVKNVVTTSLGTFDIPRVRGKEGTVNCVKDWGIISTTAS